MATSFYSLSSITLKQFLLSSLPCPLAAGETPPETQQVSPFLPDDGNLGISTHEFHVKYEPLKKQGPEEIQQKDSYKRSGQLLAVQATRAPYIVAQGS